MGFAHLNNDGHSGWNLVGEKLTTGISLPSASTTVVRMSALRPRAT